MDFSDPNNWGNISRGTLFDAAWLHHSDMERPLTFFIPEVEDPSTGKLSKSDGDFSPVLVNGKMRAVEQQIVVTLKPRLVLVISHNDICQTTSFDFVHVAPVMTITEHDKTKRAYEKMKNDDHPFFIYLPETVTGRECYVDLSQLTSVHKSLLLNKKKFNVPDNRMSNVEEVITELLDMGVEDSEEVAV